MTSATGSLWIGRESPLYSRIRASIARRGGYSTNGYANSTSRINRNIFFALWKQSDQAGAQHARHRHRKLLPKVGRQREFAVGLAVIRHFLAAHQNDVVRQFPHLGTPMGLEFEWPRSFLRPPELEFLISILSRPAKRIEVHKGVGGQAAEGRIRRCVIDVHAAAKEEVHADRHDLSVQGHFSYIDLILEVRHDGPEMFFGEAGRAQAA